MGAFQEEKQLLKPPSFEHRYCFIYGPLDKRIFLEVQRRLNQDPRSQMFWKVTGGNYQEACEFDHLFEGSQVHLFIEEPLEIMAIECAKNTSELDFAHYFFTQQEQLKGFSEQLTSLYIFDYYYLNEKKSLPVLAEHIIKNLKDSKKWSHLKKAQRVFKNTPLIILGAGPSFDENVPFLKAQLAHIPKMAIGSALGLCYDREIEIDFGVMCCPSEESYQRLHGKIKCDLLFALLRTHAELLSSYQGKKVILNQSASFGFDYLNKLLGDCPITLPIGASTSASLAIMIAIYLGFNPIITCGIDLKYGKKSYSGEIKTSRYEQRFYPEILAFEEISRKYRSQIFRLGEGSFCENIKEMTVQQIFDLIKDSQDLNLKKSLEVFEPYTCDFEAYLQELKNNQDFLNQEILAFVDLETHRRIFSVI